MVTRVNVNLLDAWSNLPDQEEARLHHLDQMVRHNVEVYRTLTSHPEYRGILFEDYSKRVHEGALKQLESFETYLLLQSNVHFQESLKWMRTRREYQHASAEIVFKFIISLCKALGSYHVSLKEEPKDYLSGEELKKLKLHAAKFQHQIKSIPDHHDDALLSCIAYLDKGLDFLAQHKAPKALRKDETFLERTYLYYLVWYFECNQLPYLPVLMTRLLDLADTPNVGANDRNLRQLIKDCSIMVRKRLSQHDEWLSHIEASI